MLHEVESTVATFLEQERLSGGAKGATEILRLAGVDLNDPLEQFAWAWRRRAMNSVMTIWAEDVHVVGPGQWIVAEPIDVATRRSGREWSAVEKPRAERRFAILREASQAKTPLLGLLQVNRWSASQLVDEDQSRARRIRFCWLILLCPHPRAGQRQDYAARTERVFGAKLTWGGSKLTLRTPLLQASHTSLSERFAFKVI